MCFASITAFDVHPLQGKKQTSEHIRKRTEAMLKARSKWTPEYREEVRQKLSDNMRGQEPWNKGKACPQLSGENHGMYGKHHTEEAKLKNSLTHRGLKQSPETVQKRVAGRAGYSHSPEVRARIRETNIITWSRDEIRTQSVGKNNATWLGGKSKEKYPVGWSHFYKETIRKRDGYLCQCCGIGEGGNGAKHSVHHIDYDKSNFFPGNLISLCRACHQKTNYKREYWVAVLRNTVNLSGLKQAAI